MSSSARQDLSTKGSLPAIGIAQAARRVKSLVESPWLPRAALQAPGSIATKNPQSGSYYEAGLVSRRFFSRPEGRLNVTPRTGS